MVGMFDQFTPKFSKQYADLGSLVQKAVGEYVAEVENQVSTRGPTAWRSCFGHISQDLCSLINLCYLTVCIFFA